MDRKLKAKLKKLESLLERLDAVVLAYSGGVDSTFLLAVCVDVLGKRVLAVTADSATYPRRELHEARAIARKLKARHLVIRTREMRDRRFVSNPLRRCYYCKKELFRQLSTIARKEGAKQVIDASNVTDKADFRPGAQAKKELGVRSPLQEAGFTKADIRQASKDLGFEGWNRPAMACLASRIPYGTAIDPGTLRRIEKAEAFLDDRGFSGARVRVHGDLCRIEVAPASLSLAAAKRRIIISGLRKLGFRYISLDLEGYRTGSMNQGIIRARKAAVK